jgi:hypothetical protein
VAQESNSGFGERQSHGLDQFCTSLEERPGLSILDLAAVNQATISFITNYGHRIYSGDFLHQLDDCFGQEGDFFENQANPMLTARFLKQAFDFEDGSFDGVLAWDSLQFLASPLLQTVVANLHRAMQPGSYLLAMFHTEEHVKEIPSYSYRIQDHRTIQLASRARRKPAQLFNNRSLEKLFQDFQSVKFFLTRDNLREVIVRR